ncbi:ribonuclease E/G [Sphingomonas paeninsulae]|uniref:Ribonuclease E n=2 Tax=Sphingomonas paeninsulae TaxID=2319844 RepID=A0A494TEK3_SPHPE|nr:ribonuclease E/G [Sphingomonas paeninsulae]
MLIDARHREETRVAVVKGNNRIEEFDFESAEHKQLKGNIYLAKVTRVEPSLQAAFIEYGGNRHGFMAFSEIHPDYYQIPKEDREALLAEEAEHAAEEERLRGGHDDDDDYADGEHGEHDDGDHGHHDDEHHDDEDGEVAPRPASQSGRGVDENAAENLRQKRMNLRRRYKIQDVIRRRQVLLVQVVKEERGNKGAALTTYLSLAGRYCVLMPNTSHGGGISRKISNVADRKRLKTIMSELDLPKSMGCIVRTAGLQRTKIEIRRDFDYLARLWDGIREETLKSAAPALVYQDSDLIKRAIRDIYNKDIEEVIVEGEEGFRHARDFMKLLMPTHARRVKPYADAVPLFQRNHVEEQLSAMYQPVVQLKSGGYLVINPTEALVSIDINSGRSTREHGIEATAVGTNLEAAHEIARQLRLRDMAGLVVIDFIDMENNSNVRKVEKAMKMALSDDRARIQVGRISSFGLMEMSRQRLRTGVLEASTRQCPHCEGTGLVRTASSAGLSALRMLEEEAGKGRATIFTLRASTEAAFYVLNRKRFEISEIEERFGVHIEVLPDGEVEGARMTVEASGPPPAHPPHFEMPVYEEDPELDLLEEEEEEEEVEEAPRGDRGERSERPRNAEGEGDGEPRRRRRRRGRRTRRDGEEGTTGEQSEPELDENGEPIEREAVAPRDAGSNGEEGDDVAVAGETTAEGEERRSRRGRRGGRRRGRGRGGENGQAEGSEAVEGAEATDGGVAYASNAEPVVEPILAEAEATIEPVAEAKPKRARKRPSKRDAEPVLAEPVVETVPEVIEAAPVEAVAEKPKRTRRAKAAPVEAAPVETAAPVEDVAPVAAPEPEAVAPVAKPKRASRAKAKVAPAAETETPAPVAVAETVSEASVAGVAQAAAPSPRTSAPAVEPTAEDGEAERPKRGWWQSTFGANK